MPAARARASTATQGIDERPAITAMVDQYFKTKYESRWLRQTQDFSGLTTGLVKSQAFIQAERDKREVELFQAEIFGLSYAKYNYFLDFADLRVDAAGKYADDLQPVLKARGKD